MKNIVMVSSSPRKGGNSDLLAREFKRGAEESGNRVIEIFIRDIQLNFCKGCLYCQSHDGCAIRDGMQPLYFAVSHADILVFATPVYYYGMSGQLKTFLDRLNPLYGKENTFRDVYLLATAADEDPAAMDGTLKGIEGWISCFDGVQLKGIVRGTGVEKAGAIRDTAFMQKAYQMGKNA